MKRLTTHIEETEALEELEEGLLRNLVRTGSVLVNATQAKRHGDTAVKHLKNVSSIVSEPLPQNSCPIEARLERIEKSLEQVAQALIATRLQIGAVGFISTSSALLADTANKAIKKKR